MSVLEPCRTFSFRSEKGKPFVASARRKCLFLYYYFMDRLGDVIRRRRQCLNCAKRFTSRERIEDIEYRVVKKDGNREGFQRQKLIAGLLTASEKRPVSIQQLEAISDRIEAELQERPEREMTTEEIGARLMQELKQLDQIAYVRFASVYRQFRDVGQFKREVDELQKSKG